MVSTKGLYFFHCSSTLIAHWCVLFSPQDVVSVLNVQHNCWDAQCTITNTRAYHLEKTQVTQTRPEITHRFSTSFIVNAGALYSSELHRLATDHEWSEVTPAEWQDAVKLGLSAWFDRCPPKETAQDPVDGPLALGPHIDPILTAQTLEFTE